MFNLCISFAFLWVRPGMAKWSSNCWPASHVFQWIYWKHPVIGGHRSWGDTSPKGPSQFHSPTDQFSRAKACSTKPTSPPRLHHVKARLIPPGCSSWWGCYNSPHSSAAGLLRSFERCYWLPSIAELIPRSPSSRCCNLWAVRNGPSRGGFSQPTASWTSAISMFWGCENGAKPCPCRWCHTKKK